MGDPRAVLGIEVTAAPPHSLRSALAMGGRPTPE